MRCPLRCPPRALGAVLPLVPHGFNTAVEGHYRKVPQLPMENIIGGSTMEWRIAMCAPPLLNLAKTSFPPVRQYSTVFRISGRSPYAVWMSSKSTIAGGGKDRCPGRPGGLGRYTIKESWGVKGISAPWGEANAWGKTPGANVGDFLLAPIVTALILREDHQEY